jgi:hypothetical protein
MNRTNRRDFLQGAASLGAGLWVAGGMNLAHCRAASDRLNIGIIGVASRGAANLQHVASENIIALCDVDENHLAAAAQQYPRARKFADWRRMIDDKEIDAVVVSTTDHTHAAICLRAMRAGKHVLCEKPIGITVEEARLLRETALQTKVATQQGTQVHATANFHKVAKLIQEGAIGPVREAHVWCTRDGGGWEQPTGDHPVPAGLNWDLWLGPAPARPYHPEYLPGCAKWNKYWDFGAGTLGDMGSHLLDFPYAALNLNLPTAIEAEGDPFNNETYPKWLRVRWDHPAQGSRPAVKVFWYDGIQRPKAPREVNTSDWHGILYIGDKGMLWANYGGYAILPANDPQAFTPPAPNVPPAAEMQGHYDEWIRACKTGSPTACNFDYAGKLIEHNMLGVVAFRTRQKLNYDAAKMKVAHVPEAERYIRRTYRRGWSLEG